MCNAPRSVVASAPKLWYNRVTMADLGQTGLGLSPMFKGGKGVISGTRMPFLFTAERAKRAEKGIF